MIEDQFGRMVESMFDDFFARAAHAAALSRWPEEGVSSPRLNVTESDKAFTVQADIPGVKKEDIKVNIDNQRVTIEAEPRRAEQQREGVDYAEGSARKYMRSFQLPADIDEASADARLEDGVLTLTLPKKQGGSAKPLTIQ